MTASGSRRTILLTCCGIWVLIDGGMTRGLGSGTGRSGSGKVDVNRAMIVGLTSGSSSALLGFINWLNIVIIGVVRVFGLMFDECSMFN